MTTTTADHDTNDSTKTSTTTNRRRVVVVGSANQDLTCYTQTLPVLGETVMGSTFESSCGGKGANQARAAASLQLCPVTMICRVGQDLYGQNLLQSLNMCHVEWESDKTVLDHHEHHHDNDNKKDKDTTPSGVAVIVVDERTGDNMILVTPGANYKLTPEAVDASLRDLQPAVVVVQLEIPYQTALQAMKTGRELGALTLLNPAPAPRQQQQQQASVTLNDFFPYVDIIIPNETELQTICGKNQCDGDGDADCDSTITEENMAKELLNRGIGKAVVCTLGARGAMIVQKQKQGDNNVHVDISVQWVDAPADLPARNEPVVDTVGAGDAFCGSLAAYLAASGAGPGPNKNDNHWSTTLLQEAVVKSCGVASMSVRRKGATYPTAAELPGSLRLSSTPTTIITTVDTKPQITFVTGNKKKLEEVKQILSAKSELAFDIINAKLDDLPELQGDDPVEIAREKCRLATEKVKGPCFTEDTSLCFHALNGMPGPYIKFFLEKCGHDGLNRMLAGFDDKTAYAQTVIAFCPGPGCSHDTQVFEGRTEGTIVPARGPPDFGWDPIFQPHESKNGLTYAEMDKRDKNDISHRGRAVEKFRTYLVEQADDIAQAIYKATT